MWTVRSAYLGGKTYYILSPWESETSIYHIPTTFYDAIETILPSTTSVSQFLPSYFSWVFYILKVNKAVRISNTNNREEQCGRLLGKQRLTNIAEQL